MTLTFPIHKHNWMKELEMFNLGHIEDSSFRSKNPYVPKNFRLDLEFVCFTNAENLAKSNPKLKYVEGWCRLHKTKSWGDHAWCVTKKGEIVDPYFEWKFPGQTIEYKPGNIHN